MQTRSDDLLPLQCWTGSANYNYAIMISAVRLPHPLSNIPLLGPDA